MTTEEDLEDFEPIEPARPLRPAAVIAVTFGFMANLGRVAAVFCDDLATLFSSHAAVEWDRVDAIAAMHRDLESLPTAVVDS